jgi:hypothetical protein
VPGTAASAVAIGVYAAAQGGVHPDLLQLAAGASRSAAISAAAVGLPSEAQYLAVLSPTCVALGAPLEPPAHLMMTDTRTSAPASIKTPSRDSERPSPGPDRRRRASSRPCCGVLDNRGDFSRPATALPIAVGDTSRSRAAARKLPSAAMATTASSSTNPLLCIIAILWIRHRSLSQLSGRSKSLMLQPYSITPGGWNTQSTYHQHHLRHHDAWLPRLRSAGS